MFVCLQSMSFGVPTVLSDTHTQTYASIFLTIASGDNLPQGCFHGTNCCQELRQLNFELQQMRHNILPETFLFPISMQLNLIA